MGEKPLSVDEALGQATTIGGAPPVGAVVSRQPGDVETPQPGSGAVDEKPKATVTLKGSDGSTFTLTEITPDVYTMAKVEIVDPVVDLSKHMKP